MTAERPDAYAVPAPVRAAAAWSWRLLLIGAAIAAGFWLATRVATILVPVAIALLITVLLTPIRNFFWRRLGLPRGLAVALSVLGLLLLLGFLIFIATRQIYTGFTDLADQVLTGATQVRNWLTDGPLHIDHAEIDRYLQEIQSALARGVEVNHILSGAMGVATTAGHFLVGAVIVVFCTIFFLLDGRTIWAWIVNLLPRTARERAYQAGRRGMVTLTAYMHSEIIVALIDAVGISLGATIFVPHLALPIGVLVFLGSWIPIAGAILSGLVATLVVFVSRGIVPALVMLAVVLFVQQLESHVLQPFVMGTSVHLHPVAVVLTVAAASMLWGIPGALFGVPVAAVLNTIILYFFGHDKYPELGVDDHVPILRKRPSFDDISLTGLTGTLRRRNRDGDDERRGIGSRITAWRTARGETAEAPEEILAEGIAIPDGVAEGIAIPDGVAEGIGGNGVVADGSTAPEGVALAEGLAIPAGTAEGIVLAEERDQ